MKTIQPFIDLGFYTVPLKGQLKRLNEGKDKTTPQFPILWKATAQEEFNETASALGGTMTGAISNIIAIDCDSQVTYDMFCSLEGEFNDFHFISKGKAKGGGTIIYKYPHIVDGTPPIPSFSIQDENINLDFYSDNGFVYLPTNSNETKVTWEVESLEDMPELHEMPATTAMVLHNLYKQYLLAKNSTEAQETEQTKIPQKVNCLAPQLELMIAKNEFVPAVFRIITPKDFRTLEQYVKSGYLHPENIPDGRGSEYLSKISAILGSDPSVSSTIYIKVLKFINELWDDPMPIKKLSATIMDPMLEKHAKINGNVIWQYDEHWKAHSLNFTTKMGDSAEVFFDDIRATYYLVNNTSNLVKAYQKSNDVYEYMDTVGIGIPVRKDFKAALPLVRTQMDPALPFGFYHTDKYTRGFNMFQQSPALRILNEPLPYKDLYTRPETILAFFKSLVPDPVMRNYLLKFLRYKLTTFNYSPVVLYFLGCHGSGKDTFVNILAKILGDSYIGRPTTKEFLEQFNGWIIDTYFTQLDEYGNQLSRLTDKQEALGKIKAYSGKSAIQIRQMRTDGFAYEHRTTFIMTANSNPLILEDGDRRMAFFDTPNVMKDAEYVIKAGGITNVQNKILAEIKDFCYYLATEVDKMHPDDYVTPPSTEGKHISIASKLPAAQRIAYYLKHYLYDSLYDVAKEYDMTSIFDHSIEGRLYEDDLFELYLCMTDEKGVKRGLASAMKEAGFDKIPTTEQGMKAYYFRITELKHYQLPDGGFSDTEESEVTL